MRCGEQYRLSKIEKAPETPAAWFIQGIAFHQAAESWEASGRQLSDAEIHEIYRTTWVAEFATAKEREPDISKWMTGGRVKPKDDIERRYQRGHDQVDGYLAYARQAPWRIWEFAPGEFATELPFSLTIGGVEVVGKIDQLVMYPDRTLRVRDLKTGTKLPDTALQLGVYNLATEDLFGVNAGWGDYYMAKNNALTDPYDLSYYTAERVGRWIRNMDKAVNLGLFLPNPGDACRTCGVRRFCDAGGAEAHLYPPDKKEEVA